MKIKFLALLFTVSFLFLVDVVLAETKIYTNIEYGFTFEYPEYINGEQVFIEAESEDNQWSGGYYRDVDICLGNIIEECYYEDLFSITKFNLENNQMNDNTLKMILHQFRNEGDASLLFDKHGDLVGSSVDGFNFVVKDGLLFTMPSNKYLIKAFDYRFSLIDDIDVVDINTEYLNKGLSWLYSLIEAVELVEMNITARLLHEERLNEVLLGLGELRDIAREQNVKIKYLEKLSTDLDKLSQRMENAINSFVTYGVDLNTKKLGEGERAAVVHSYKAAFDKLPETEEELADIIKIANGRWPTITNDEAEKRAKVQFEKIYKRIANMDEPQDNAAITVMAYGLKQKAENRNLESERAGIKTFTHIYGYGPSSTEDWNTMQAITYSGATRGVDSDGDLLTDERENELGTDKNNPDTDGDGYGDGAEVANGYNPNGEGKLCNLATECKNDDFLNLDCCFYYNDENDDSQSYFYYGYMPDNGDVEVVEDEFRLKSQILIIIDENYGKEDFLSLIEEYNDKYGVEVLGCLNITHTFLLRVPNDDDLDKIMEELNADPVVIVATKNYIFSLD